MKFTSFTRQTTVISGRITKINEHVKTIASQHTAENLTENISSKLKNYYTIIESKLHEFDALVDKLAEEGSPTDFDIEHVLQSQDDFSELVFETRNAIKILLPHLNSSETDLNTSAVSKESEHAKHLVKLPKINLPTFNGNLSEWTSFYHLFDTTIHQNQNLAPIEKFTYLRSCLKDEALNLIKSLPITPLNYCIAWQNLGQRYQNPRRLINLHITKIIDLPSININSVKGIRNFIDTFNENAQALKVLNHDISQELTLITLIHRKLDSELNKRFEDKRNLTHIVPKIDELITFLQDECLKLEDSQLHSNAKSTFVSKQTLSRQSFKKPNLPPYGETHKKHVFHVNASATLLCNFCNKTTHNIYSCEEFQKLTPSERLKFIQTKRNCTNCLSDFHTISSCKSQKTCQKCNAKHHTLLHLSSVPHSTDDHNKRS